MEAVYLNGVGKKLRKSYLDGNVSDSHVIEVYKANKKEADNFSSFGLKANELTLMLRACHNPILSAKLQECIDLRNEMSRKSKEQNKISLEKLANFQENALGVGLRKVISALKHESKRSRDKRLKIVTLLLETEFANLSAKSHGKALKGVIYERKGRLLDELSDLLYDSNWKYGFNDNCGKNASYLVYVYLPNGVQLTWHSNDYCISKEFPLIDCQWDGKVCSTMEKLLAYIKDEYADCLKVAA